MFIDKKFINSFLPATEMAAVKASLFKGKADKIGADQAAVDGMRSELNKIDMIGKIVIGEGELDEAPMLFINEIVGTKKGEKFDIAVDPLEGTNFVAKNLPNALAVLAVGRSNNLLNAPDMYMEKIAIGPNLPKNLIDLDYTVEKNIKLLSQAKKTTPDKLTACILDRPRHNKIINQLKEIGVKINFITDGDVSAVLAVADQKSKIDIFIGTGGAPEGVLAAAGLSCLNCQMQTRLVFENDTQRKRASSLGIRDLKKKYYIDDMAKGDVIFCATGVTDGDLVKGIIEDDNFYITETLVLHKSSKTQKIFKNKIKK